MGKDYCTECEFRLEKTDKKGEERKNPLPIVTNRSDFCAIGYTQNPRTEDATRVAVVNGAIICSKNPYKYL